MLLCRYEHCGYLHALAVLVVDRQPEDGACSLCSCGCSTLEAWGGVYTFLCHLPHPADADVVSFYEKLLTRCSKQYRCVMRAVTMTKHFASPTPFMQERAVALEARDQAMESLSVVEEVKATAAAAKAEGAAAAAAAAEWLDKFIKERAVRRKLHEQLQVCLQSSYVYPRLGTRAVAG